MTVKELIALLQKEDQERIVILSSLGDGNSYSELCSLETTSYIRGMAGGEISNKKVGKYWKPALVFYPMN